VAPVLWWVGFSVMLAGLLAPILAVPVPPLTDYPNHLARGLFLAQGAQDPMMRRMFAVRWGIIPNLATDLLLPPLIRLMPPLAAGRVVIALAVLLPSTGVIALSRVWSGRLSWWSLGAGFVAYNTMFLIGVLNFQIAVGVALWGAACWLLLAERRLWLAWLTGAGIALAAFFCHLFGFAFYALLIGCAELARIDQRGLRDAGARRFALIRCGAVLGVVIVPVVLYLAAPFAAAGGEVYWQSPGKKFDLFLVPLLAYSRPAALVAAAAIAIPLMVWGWQRRLRVAPLAVYAAPLLLMAYAMLPVGAKGGYWIDTRVPVLLGFLLFACVAPHDLPRWQGRLAAAVLAGLFVLRMASITLIWRDAQQEIEDARRVLRLVTPGSRVLVVDGNRLKDPDTLGVAAAHGFGGVYRHYGAFAFIDRRAFWSDAFALAGQQPVVERPPYDQSGDGGLRPPRPYTRLVGAIDAPSRNPAHFMDGWLKKEDDVLLLDAEALRDPAGLLPQYMTPIAQSATAILFAVKR
jgi:hypothetical protein